MGLEVLRGRISHYRAERHFADFVFTASGARARSQAR